MLKRQTSGSVVCPSCGRLVGVLDDRCFNCGRSNPGLWGWAPLVSRFGRDLGFTQIVIAGCVAVYLLGLLYDTAGVRMSGILSLFSPSTKALLVFGASGGRPVFELDRWWTVLSAAWLHGGLIHIGFNLMILRQIAPLVGEAYGAGRLVIIYAVSSITGFGLTSLAWLLPLPGVLRGADFTVGASAPLFGLIGALWLYGHRTGSRHLSQQMLQWVVFMAMFGLLVPSVDNWAHAGGLAGGYVLAKWLDPLEPERQEHLLIALVALVIMAASLVVSFVHAQRFFFG